MSGDVPGIVRHSAVPSSGGEPLPAPEPASDAPDSRAAAPTAFDAPTEELLGGIDRLRQFAVRRASFPAARVTWRTPAAGSTHPATRTADGPKAPAADTAADGDGRSGPLKSSRQLRTNGHRSVRDERISQLEGQLADLVAAQAVQAARPAPGLLTALGSFAAPIVERLLPDPDPDRAMQLSRQLDQEQALNFLAEALHAVGGSDAARKALEGVGINLGVIAGDGGGALAQYDSDAERIEVPEATLTDALQVKYRLADAGIVDEHGNVVAGRHEDLDRSRIADEALKIANVVGLHEALHAEQDAGGLIDEIQPTLEALRQRDGDEAAERYRAAQLEVEAYRRQETADLQVGAARKVFVTIDSWQTDASGKVTSIAYLGPEQAAENVFALETGQPLPHGPDRGYTGEGLDMLPVTGGQEHEHDSGLVPAPAAPLAALPGAELPGARHPGARHPGARHPQTWAAAVELPGARHPGARHPGARHPQTWAPAVELPGARHPGARHPGARHPGARHPHVDTESA